MRKHEGIGVSYFLSYQFIEKVKPCLVNSMLRCKSRVMRGTTSVVILSLRRIYTSSSDRVVFFAIISTADGFKLVERMKKLDQDFIKWLLEWTTAALIVTLVVWWVCGLVGSKHSTPWDQVQVPQIKVVVPFPAFGQPPSGASRHLPPQAGGRNSRHSHRRGLVATSPIVINLRVIERERGVWMGPLPRGLCSQWIGSRSRLKSLSQSDTNLTPQSLSNKPFSLSKFLGLMTMGLLPQAPTSPHEVLKRI